MRRQRITRNALAVDVPDNILRILRDEEPEPGDSRFARFQTAELERAWRQVGPQIVEAWARRYPGSRPSYWWLLDAPRATPCERYSRTWFGATLPQPRERLGGRGTPKHEALNYKPAYAYGLPVAWLSDADFLVYAAMGKPLAAEHFDRDDPPVFESESAYLARHDLLRSGERARLRAAHFEAEVLPTRYWPT